jgi:polysaccharide deacetylase family protein (PEP-CTERM system associated)
MLNALSVDVEDYFHVEAFSNSISPDSWVSRLPRVERNVALILEMFKKYNAKGTFFVLGWVAEHYPQIVRQIADAGHEIGCHSFSHKHILRQTPDQFRGDIRKARNLLMDLTQRPVLSYRAPSFSIVYRTLWALDILAEEGFVYDSSIFPVRHDLYGIPDADRFPHWHVTDRSQRIFEFPPSTIRIAGMNLGVGGGGYLRLIPYWFTRWALKRINGVEQQPAMIYFHPWELDPVQPRISAPLRSRLRHYTNLSIMQSKIERLLQDFSFSTVSDVCSRIKTCPSGEQLTYAMG